MLLIEIADSSLEYDQNLKLRLYAMHNIAEYWLLNINKLCIEVYRHPKGELYTEKTTLRAGDPITSHQPEFDRYFVASCIITILSEQ